MACQLVYTSAPRGLKPGAFGFCVVACTRGMKEQTTSALEALSGYRRVYADSRDASRNPTAYSHVLFETPTGRLRILARVADAGLDYSGRTNKIASFLSVAENELAPPGPAALFSQPGLFVANWSSSSAPRYYEAPIALPNYVPIPLGCDEWRKTTGDPAWAGVLASTVATRKPVVLIVRPDQNVLRLFQESLALLPAGERWKATFSTYYMKTPPGVQCQWRAVMQGSPEELALRSAPGVLVLDLTSPINLPSLASLVVTQEEKALVAAASGRLQTSPLPSNVPQSFPATASVAPPPTTPGASPLPGAAPIGVPTPYDLAPSDSPSPAPKRKTLNYGRDAVLTVTPPPKRGNREVALLTKVLVCLGAAVISCGIVVAILWASGVFDSLIGYKKTLDEAVAEANGQPAVSPTPENPTPEPAPPATPETDKSQKAPSEEGSKTEQDSDESSKSDELGESNEQTSETDASEEPQSSQNATDNDAQKPEEEENESETEQAAVNSHEDDDVETDDEQEKEATDDDEEESKSDVNNNGTTSDDQNAAGKIEEALEKFEKEGGEDNFRKAQNLVGNYRQRKSSGKLKVAVDHFDRIQRALEFNSFKKLAWSGKVAEEILKPSSDDELEYIETGLYQDLDDFFSYFKTGRVKLIFRSYKDNDVQEMSNDVTAEEFKNLGSGSEFAEKIELKLGDSSENQEKNDLFKVGLLSDDKRAGALSFSSADSARDWLLFGTFEIEAYANSDSSKSKPVFHQPQRPLLNGSDISVDLSNRGAYLDSQRLLGKEGLAFSDTESDSKTLFLEYAPVEGTALKVVTSSDELEAICGSSRSRLKNKTKVILKGQERSAGSLHEQVEFALVVSFTNKRNRIELDSNIQYREKRFDAKGKGKRIEWVDADEKPRSLENIRVLTFNVRYRASAKLKDEASPIIGVLKVPII